MTVIQDRRDNNRFVLMSFVNYCAANPDQRFWQALASWSGHHIFAMELHFTPTAVMEAVTGLMDTWEWKGHRR